MKPIERRLAALELAAAADNSRGLTEIRRPIVDVRDHSHVAMVLRQRDPVSGVWSTRTLEGDDFDEWCDRVGYFDPAPRMAETSATDANDA